MENITRSPSIFILKRNGLRLPAPISVLVAAFLRQCSERGFHLVRVAKPSIRPVGFLRMRHSQSRFVRLLLG
jgi:hypothetical protein